MYLPMNTTIPVEIASILLPFRALFTKPVWYHVQTLVIGAILTTGKRTITSVLIVMGLNQEEHFQNYHRVLNQAVWSSLKASRILLTLMVTVFLPSGPIIMGIDDTIERRKGNKIKAKGIYRDPVRSSNSQVVKVSGLR
ncbi:transposase, partial [Nostoc sp. FACHB-133]|uniref:transposase n=1 Tax=Nostoc sp. FACHB-133 TaxID=2692835 RepID=UPI001685D7FC